MTTEANAAPDVAADTATSDQITNTPPEVVTPESSTDEQAQPTEKTEQDDSDKSLKRMQRRVDRVTAARYHAEAEARQLREQLAQYQQQTQPETEQQFKPEEVEGFISTRAEQLSEAREVDRRGREISRELEKLAGSQEALTELVETVTEEAGPFINPKTGKWTALGEAVDDSKNPAALIQYLGLNPDIAASLQGLSAARLGRRIEAIERDMKTAKVSKSPAPLQPVTPKGAPVAKAETSMTDAEWYAARRKRS